MTIGHTSDYCSWPCDSRQPAFRVVSHKRACLFRRCVACPRSVCEFLYGTSEFLNTISGKAQRYSNHLSRFTGPLTHDHKPHSSSSLPPSRFTHSTVYAVVTNPFSLSKIWRSRYLFAIRCYNHQPLSPISTGIPRHRVSACTAVIRHLAACRVKVIRVGCPLNGYESPSSSAL